jgi:hypothetical protein
MIRLAALVVSAAAVTACASGPKPTASSAGTAPSRTSSAPTTTGASTEPATSASREPSATERTGSAPTGRGWTSRPVAVTRHPAVQPRLVAVRAAHHATFDRVVFEFAGALPGYRIRYVPKVVQDGSGRTIRVEGQAFLQVVLDPAVAHTDAGAPTNPSRVKTGYPSLREVVRAGDFEGIVTYALGLDDVVGFRVLSLRAPSRIVVDVAG